MYVCTYKEIRWSDYVFLLHIHFGKSRALFPIVSRVESVFIRRRIYVYMRHVNFSIRLNTSDCLVMCVWGLCVHVLRVLESHKINFMCLLSAHVSFGLPLIFLSSFFLSIDVLVRILYVYMCVNVRELDFFSWNFWSLVTHY